MTFGLSARAVSSARASVNVEQRASRLFAETAQHARSAAMLTSGATPMMPSRLFTADAMIPATAVPCTSPARAPGYAAAKSRVTPDPAAQIGMAAVDRGIDDRDRHAAAGCELMGFLHFHLDRRGLQAGIGIVVAGRLRRE